MKQFYNVFSNEKVSTMWTQLSWRELLTIKDLNEISYYINLVSSNKLSKRELREEIKSNEYKRLPIETKS